MADGLSGLASGIDTASIVDQLIAVDRQSVAKKQLGLTSINARTAGLQAVSTNLNALRSAVQALRDPTTWADTQTVETSDATKLTATRLSGAAPGGSTINVTKLATGEQRTYAYSAQTGASSITIGSTRVDLAANATLDDAVRAINTQDGSPVYATNVGGKMVLSARTTGAASGFSVTADSLAEDTSRARVGADAEYTIDGGATQKAASNVVTDAIAGLSLTFKSLGASTVTVGAAGVDQSAVKTKIQTFVDAYNAVITEANAEVTTKPVQDPQSTSDAGHGVLFGDSGLSSIVDTLRRAISDPVAGAKSGFDSLGLIGISTGAATATVTADSDSVMGKLTIDTDKLTTALTADPNAIKRLFGGVSGVDGFSQRIDKLVSAQTDTGGSLAARIASGPSETKNLQSIIDEANTRIDAKQAQLKAQFAAMEAALFQSNNQSSWLAGQIAKL